MVGQVSPTSEEAPASRLPLVEESLLDDSDSYAMADGTESAWGDLNLDSFDYSQVDFSSYLDFNGQMIDTNSEYTEHGAPEEASVETIPEFPQPNFPTIGKHDFEEANIPSEPVANIVCLDTMLANDGLPADTFDAYRDLSDTTEPICSRSQPETSAATNPHLVMPNDLSNEYEIQPLQSRSQYQGDHAMTDSLQGIEIRPRTLAQPTPQCNRALEINELWNSPIHNDARPPHPHAEYGGQISSPGKDSTVPRNRKDDGKENEDRGGGVIQESRKPKFQSPFQANLTDSKRQKQKAEPAKQPVKEAPRPLVRPNPRYARREGYTYVDHPCENWDDFKYSKYGELEPSKLYSAEQINHYLFDHPLHKSAADKTSSELILRVHRNPSRSATRFPTTLSHRCRFADCPIQTINQGHISVSFCEIDKSHPNHDPFLEAGWVHLYCLERFTDFPRVCAKLNILADTRELQKEEHGKNFFKLGTDAEAKLAHKFIKACRTDTLPDNYPEQIEGDDYEYEGTLSHRLALTKVKKEPKNYGTQRSVREELAGYKGSNIGSHMGDLVLEAQLRRKTRLHVNQNSNLEYPRPSRHYRNQRRAGSQDEDDSESERVTDGESEEEDDDNEAAMQEEWLRNAEQKPRRRRVAVADMGQWQPSSKPSPKPQPPLPANRAPSRSDRIYMQWLQKIEQKPRPRRAPPANQPPHPHRNAMFNGPIVDNRLQSFESRIASRTPAPNVGYQAQPHQSLSPYQAPDAYMGSAAQVMPQYQLPAPYAGSSLQLPGQYSAPHLQYPRFQGQPAPYFQPQQPQMPYTEPPMTEPSRWTPVDPNYYPTGLTPPSSRKRNSEEAGNDKPPTRYGQGPEHRQPASIPQFQQPQQPSPSSKKRARDEPHDWTNDDVEEPWLKKARHRLAPTPPKKITSRKKARTPYHHKTQAERRKEKKSEAQTKAEWQRVFSPEAVAVRNEIAEARQRGDIGEEDMVFLKKDDEDRSVEPSPQEKREALQRMIEFNRKKREVERENEEFLRDAEEEEDEDMSDEGGGVFGDDVEETEEEMVTRKRRELGEQMMRQRVRGGKDGGREE